MTISTLVVIPARAGSSRLPRKPLRLIAGLERPNAGLVLSTTARFYAVAVRPA